MADARQQSAEVNDDEYGNSSRVATTHHDRSHSVAWDDGKDKAAWYGEKGGDDAYAWWYDEDGKGGGDGYYNDHDGYDYFGDDGDGTYFDDGGDDDYYDPTDRPATAVKGGGGKRAKRKKRKKEENRRRDQTLADLGGVPTITDDDLGSDLIFSATVAYPSDGIAVCGV